jgi:phosphatidylethanolamine/phosphatidyl-N-methylethanolamine N-methyltransferase
MSVKSDLLAWPRARPCPSKTWPSASDQRKKKDENGRGHHVAIEVNHRFAERLAVRYPQVDVVNADATTLGAVLEQRGIGPIDVVVSGLPWAAFAERHQHDVLTAVVAAMAPDAVFTTFAYVHARWAPPARRLLRSLESRFDEVVVGRTVWANLPPALVYHCRRPNLPVTATL